VQGDLKQVYSTDHALATGGVTTSPVVISLCDIGLSFKFYLNTSKTYPVVKNGSYVASVSFFEDTWEDNHR